jgi:hypothetical protein
MARLFLLLGRKKQIPRTQTFLELTSRGVFQICAGFVFLGTEAIKRDGAVEWIRTTTVLLPPAPQAGASASSATTALENRGYEFSSLRRASVDDRRVAPFSQPRWLPDRGCTASLSATESKFGWLGLCLTSNAA